MKKSLFLLFVSTSVYLFSITQSPAQSNTSLSSDLSDNRWQGFFLGGTIGYGVTQWGLSVSADEFNEDDKFENLNNRSTSGNIRWRLGYAVSEKMGFYIASPLLQPALGILRFSDEDPDFYYNALLGYARIPALPRITGTNFDQYFNYIDVTQSDTWTLNLGVGKKFRRHYAIELTAGFTRTTIPNAYPNAYWDSTFRSVHLNGLSLFASFSYWLY